MLLAGDEFGNSQAGNNNAYCQDNEISWLDWAQAKSPSGRELTTFTQRLIALRRDHPSLRFARFQDANYEILPNLPRVSWYDMDGTPMTDEAWEYSEGRVLGLRRAAILPNEDVDASLLLVNGGPDDIEFTLPEMDCQWVLALDTGAPQNARADHGDNSVVVVAHGVVLLTCVIVAGSTHE